MSHCLNLLVPLQDIIFLLSIPISMENNSSVKGCHLIQQLGKIASDDILLSDPPGLLTKGQCIPFRLDNIDFIPDAPSLIVLSGPEAKQAYNCFFKETDIFNDAKITSLSNRT
jgi:hypothetical protein